MLDTVKLSAHPGCSEEAGIGQRKLPIDVERGMLHFERQLGFTSFQLVTQLRRLGGACYHERANSVPVNCKVNRQKLRLDLTRSEPNKVHPVRPASYAALRRALLRSKA
jgi:hypothetical protein